MGHDFTYFNVQFKLKKTIEIIKVTTLLMYFHVINTAALHLCISKLQEFLEHVLIKMHCNGFL